MASSAAIRGSEAQLFVNVGGRRFQLLTKSFRGTPDFELRKDSYVGTKADQANPQFRGVDGSWDCDEDDAQALELRDLLMAREEAGLSPPTATIQAKYRYRKTGVRPRVELYSGVTLAPKGRETPGAKENITNAFEFFSPTRPKLLTQ